MSDDNSGGVLELQAFVIEHHAGCETGMAAFLVFPRHESAAHVVGSNS
jgi:hypothetical protein